MSRSHLFVRVAVLVVFIQAIPYKGATRVSRTAAPSAPTAPDRAAATVAFSQLWPRFVDWIHSRSRLGLWNTVRLKLLHYNLVTAGHLAP